MSLSEAHISPLVSTFLEEKLEETTSMEELNQLLQDFSGITGFFNKEEEIIALQDKFSATITIAEEPRRAYGDFQTNTTLAQNITQYLSKKKVSPTIILEPTCGKGAFILAALQQFTSIQQIIGIEIYLPYVWQTKFSILELFLQQKALCKPQIILLHEDVFKVEFQKIIPKNPSDHLLILGNPPWVTNAALTTLNSDNLPQKSNFKKYKGLEAVTGKGNFDIGESISLQLLKAFHQYQGHFAFLVKKSVIKNIVQELPNTNYQIGHLQQLNIDARKEFKAAVSAAVFSAQLDASTAFTCLEKDFYAQKVITQFGWYKDKFIYSIPTYNTVKAIDGSSPFVWRQGMKHDCSKIMELDYSSGYYQNGFKEKVSLEEDLLYGLLKSSDLKNEVLQTTRKTTIITQKKIGQDTHYIQEKYPKTYHYLNANRAYFERRKSSIYKGKPPFSIFGIGAYSFKKYKVAISGMYKRTTFSLVFPIDNKPTMLDDTCYFIGFDKLEEAQITQKILNSPLVQDFLKALIFLDAKRPITKSILMRIDLHKAYQILSQNKEYYTLPEWENFSRQFSLPSTNPNQPTLF